MLKYFLITSFAMCCFITSTFAQPIKDSVSEQPLLVKQNNICVVNATVAKQSPLVLPCEQGKKTPLPSYLQFTCDGSATLMAVTIRITDGKRSQSIQKDVMVNEEAALYEVALTGLLNSEMKKNKNARIESITFSNLIKNSEVTVQDINFSNASSFVELKMGQTLVIDADARKNYFIQSPKDNLVNINLATVDGENSQCITGNLFPGQNVLALDTLQLANGKYTVVITQAIEQNIHSTTTVMN